MMEYKQQVSHSGFISVAEPVSLSIHRHFAALILALTTFAIISIVIIWRSVVVAPNPFVEYADILPGHNRQTAELHGFGCQQATNNYSYYSSGYATCTLLPASGAFSQIEVVLDKDVIVQSTFRIRENTLRFGDLMLTMDMRILRTYPNELFFFWQTFFINVKTSVKKKAIALRPIGSITFTDPGFQWQDQFLQDSTEMSDVMLMNNP